jgi:type III secretion protein S
VLQAVTQIQDQSIGLTVRMIAVMVTVLLMAGWAGQELLRYAGGALELVLTGRPGLL